MSEPLLQLDEVEAGYGPVTVLHGISLTVGDGEIVAVADTVIVRPDPAPAVV